MKETETFHEILLPDKLLQQGSFARNKKAEYNLVCWNVVFTSAWAHQVPS